MPKLKIVLLILLFVALIALLVVGMEIFGPGSMDTDAMMPWLYVALVCMIGVGICGVAGLVRYFTDRK